MQRLRDGDMNALGELYLKYGNMVAHAIIAASPSIVREEVEDVTQDVFIAVANAAKRYQESGKLKSWIYSVAVRTARKRRRTQLLHEKLLGNLRGRPVGVSPPHSMPEATSMSKVDLYRAFKDLTEKQRQVIVLFELEGMSGEEVSEMLDIRLNTVWSHLRRARKRILDAFGQPESAREVTQ